MTKLSQEELEAIRARCDAADFTEPVQVVYVNQQIALDNEQLLAFLMHGSEEDGEFVCVDEEPDPFGDVPSPRLEYIADLVNKAPALLSHIEAQATEIAEKDARIKELELKLQDVEDEIGWFASEALRDGGEG